MTESEAIVILGAGLAGVSAAAALRMAGHAGPIRLLSREKRLPYDRPPLSKAILQRSRELEDIYLRPESWYGDNEIELISGTSAHQIDPDRHEVLLDDGSSIAYGKLLIATGSELRRIPALETGTRPFFYMRTDVDAIALREALEPGRHLVLVGAGVIGLEVAASAVERGCEVTVLEICDRVMARSVPADISQWMQEQHEAHGVTFRCLEQVDGYSEDADNPGVLMASGEVLPADLVVIGAGVIPSTELARECGLECEDGITVNEYGETSAEDIYAAGDVAWYPDAWAGRHMRSENWKHAKKHAECVTKNMLGQRVAYEEIQSMWTDQYDVKLQTVGVLEGDRQIERGDRESGQFMVFYLNGDTVAGALGVNQAKFMRLAQNMITSRGPVDPEVLADPTANLRKAML